MKHNPNPKRGRSRGSGKRGSSGKGRNFESSGSDNKIRGNARQVLDKYLNLARDAHTSGDRVMAENYYQFAEHYYRIVNASGDGDGDEQGGQNRQGGGQNRGDKRDQAKEQAAAPEQNTPEKDGNTQAPEGAPDPASDSGADSEPNSESGPEPKSVTA